MGREPSLSVLYPIIDIGACRARGADPLRLAEACLRAGTRVVQLRFKTEGSGEVLALLDRLTAAARAFDAGVIVNDRPDLAAMSGAAGVHVGQGDLPVQDARALAGPDRIVGVSTHDRAQIDAALLTTADYVAVGPVFTTSTKETGYTARGLDLVRYAAGRGRPVVAIGGITVERAGEVLRAGAAAVAVISDLLTDDPLARARTYLSLA